MAQQGKDQPASEEADFAKVQYQPSPSSPNSHPKLTCSRQAFQELAKGEQTATALENHLSALEAKIEAMLAQVDQGQQATSASQSQISKSTSETTTKTDETKP